MAVKILNNEKAYVDSLHQIISLFLEPLKKAATGNYPILSNDIIEAVFFSIHRSTSLEIVLKITLATL
jgi:hypothetical protein